MGDTETTELLTTTNASIATVQVSIQCVRIGPKQMTQAIFRQLPCQSLVMGYGTTSRGDHTYRLHVQPEAQLWGLINYFWPRCDEEANLLVSPEQPREMPHFHLLYAQHGRLWRDCLLHPDYMHMLRGDLKHSQRYDFSSDETYCELYKAFWNEHIEVLPQLFIAV